MIRAYLCDTSAFISSADVSAMNEREAPIGAPRGKSFSDIREAAKLCARQGVRSRESEAAYLLLFACYLKEHPENEIPRVVKSELGKPYFEGCREARDVYFSLSHREGVALVAFSDEGEIGADIEEIFPHREEKMRSVCERYMRAQASAELQECELSLAFCVMNEDGNVEFCAEKDNNNLHIAEKNASDEAYVRWTVFEAVLKSGGVGLDKSERFSALAASTRLRCEVVAIGERRFALTAAFLNNDLTFACGG